ncbi:insulinase family protein [Bacteroides salyersiae]|jgi:putative protease|uniref:M16 family metallopeptidase n=1 Tax=Bacteroides salyersiae TaxID=291644 RepID=UPI001899F410|nr:pitrilysin family protein [Bacteroides salyersiae]MBT9872063.1 insulinase family protein [Bacteroides salyersiae]QUT74768.1 putative zinc protease [Bacteroides salyersiae]
MIKISRHVLANGLRLVHSQDESTQMVALNIVYNVGARDEHPDHTGFAHLFEHLMFGGSVNIPDYDAPLQLAGGENNAWTNNDITNYYLTVPRQNVEIGFWLESDRMLSLDFNERSLDVQRGVVMEEFKQRCLNQPYGDVGHLLRPLAYKVHPYQWPTIGKELSHIANATLDEVKDFFFRFYAPNNAVLAVTGNISFEETVALTEKWFASIPKRDVPVRQLPQEPAQTEERRLVVERNVPVDSLFMAYHMCERAHPDYYAFDILSDILSNGKSSRLNRHLVQEKQLFSSIDAYISGTVDAGLFHISGKPAAGVSLEEAETAVREELNRLQNEAVAVQELEKVKNKFESTQIFGNINYLNVATNLAWFELNGAAEDMEKEVERYRSVTAGQLQAVAQTVFDKRNGVVLYYKGLSPAVSVGEGVKLD